MDKIYLIDGTAILYRAYFAFIANPLRNSKGENTSAIFGVANSFLKLLGKRGMKRAIISFDLKEPTFRHKITDTYKANRPQAPDELISQIEPVKEFFRQLEIPEISIPGYEADDVLATLSQKLKDRYEVIIVTSDKDFCQLVDDRVVLYDPYSEKIINNKEVIEKYNVTPEQFSDYLAIIGDPTDNIAGIKGIGPKGAAQLLSQYPSLDEIYANIDKIDSISLREKLLEGKESAYLSYQLASILKDIPELEQKEYNIDKIEKDSLFTDDRFKHILSFLEKYELHSILKKIQQTYPQINKNESQADDAKPDQLSFDFFEKQTKMEIDVEIIDDHNRLAELVSKFTDCQVIALDIVTDEENPQFSSVIGISLCAEVDKSYYIHLRENPDNEKFEARSLAALNKILSSVKIIGHNIKSYYRLFNNSHLNIRTTLFDTMLASYILDAFTMKHNLEDCAQRVLQKQIESKEEVLGKGQKKTAFKELSKDFISRYSGNNAIIIHHLYNKYQPRLKDSCMENLFYNIEIPLLPVLAKMERDGVFINIDILEEINNSITEEIDSLTQKIFGLTGQEFNINSPQQLAKILFEDMGIPSRKKTQTGYSTDNTVLEQLAEEYDIAKLIVEYRQLTKLRSTYTEALPKLIDKNTGRIHSTFNQTITTTGRLSSSNPNLQNIPIRSKAGKQVRKAFSVDNQDKVIISADYSQIELRILGIMSKDRNLITAFLNEQDIHAQTAGLILNKPITMVNQDERRMAKTINFGIIYGMGPQKLSRELGITLNQAKDFIEAYFTKFPRIREFIQLQIKKAKTLGYAETLIGRRLNLPNIHSSNKKFSSEAERIAVNMPIQGSAADVIKIAMVNISRELEKLPSESGERAAKLIIQVHDELVLECYKTYLTKVKELVVREMKYALPEKSRTIIPLAVDIGSGQNWYEAHD